MDDDEDTNPLARLYEPLTPQAQLQPLSASPDMLSETPRRPLPTLSNSQVTPTPLATQKTPTPYAPPLKVRSPSFPRFLRRPSSKRSSSMDSTMFSQVMNGGSSTPNLVLGPLTPTTMTMPASGATTPTTPTTSRPGASKVKFRKSWGPKNKDYNFSAAQNDILGIVLLEIKGAKDLPRLRNRK